MGSQKKQKKQKKNCDKGCTWIGFKPCNWEGVKGKLEQNFKGDKIIPSLS